MTRRGRAKIARRVSDLVSREPGLGVSAAEACDVPVRVEDDPAVTVPRGYAAVGALEDDPLIVAPLLEVVRGFPPNTYVGEQVEDGFGDWLRRGPSPTPHPQGRLRPTLNRAELLKLSSSCASRRSRSSIRRSTDRDAWSPRVARTQAASWRRYS